MTKPRFDRTSVRCMDCRTRFPPKNDGPLPKWCPTCARKRRGRIEARPSSIDCRDCGLPFSVNPRGTVPFRCPACRAFVAAARTGAVRRKSPAERDEVIRSDRFSARFWAKVQKTDTCWLWTAALDGRGYGKIGAVGWFLQSHRVSYLLLAGPIPDDLQLDHLCRVRNCVNPDHLEPVTARTNVLRGESPMAYEARQTHCLRGHEFTPENTYVWVGQPNQRKCRKCRSDRALEKREATWKQQSLSRTEQAS